MKRETVRTIIQQVAERTGIKPADIIGRSRARQFSRPRQAAAYLARIKTGKSYAQIGRVLGRDHTTIIYSVRAVESAPHLYPIGELE